MTARLEKALTNLAEAHAGIQYQKEYRSDSASFKSWQRRAAAGIEALFGRDSRETRDWEAITSELVSKGLPDQATWLHAEEFLESLVVEARTTSSDETPSTAHAPTGRRVFIVHGHDDNAKWELNNFLRDLGLEPMILHEQDDLGKTIIEKFEHYAAFCSFAFVLMTPDDKSDASQGQEARWRARQNVIMELGWFMARLGRDRVAILHRGAVELPSDILGVIYMPFERSVMEVSERIRKRLTGLRLLGA